MRGWWGWPVWPGWPGVTGMVRVVGWWSGGGGMDSRDGGGGGMARVPEVTSVAEVVGMARDGWGGQGPPLPSPPP